MKTIIVDLRDHGWPIMRAVLKKRWELVERLNYGPPENEKAPTAEPGREIACGNLGFTNEESTSTNPVVK